MKPTMAWAPPVIIEPDFDDSFQAATKHVRETKTAYGHQYWINLIDKKKDQGRIGDAFTRVHTALNDKDIKYTWFDFHGECKNMKWGNLSKLVDEVKD
jgi:phosphatidylinositol 4-phosphatase